MLNYKVRSYTFKQLKNSIVVPKFQRNLVWNKERKEKFIRTILNGDPFGILLIYSNPLTHKEQIIDGLQRFTTLLNFEYKPFELLEFDEFDFDEFKKISHKILQIHTSLTEEEILNGTIEAFKEILSEYNYIEELVPKDEFNNIFAKRLIERFYEIKGTTAQYQIDSDIYEIWRKLKDRISLDDIEIPIIVYHGDEKHLPDLFERLNTGGTKLSKYEVFASSWSNNVLTKMDSRITKEVDKKYIALMEETQLEIENYIEGSIELNGEVTLYEFCYALGKLIKQKNKVLFGYSNITYDSVDSIGFSTIASALGLHLQDMPKINLIINDKISSAKLKRFVDALLLSFEDLSKLLLSKRMTFNKYIEAQIISLGITLFKINYDFDLSNFETTANNSRNSILAKFNKHSTNRYFYDMIRNYWSGNGDNKLYELITSPLENNRYLFAIDEETWKLSLKEWLSDLQNKKPKTPTQETKVFLGMVYAPLNDLNEFEKIKVSYVVPKHILEMNKILENAAHPGNLFLLNSKFKDYFKTLILDERFNNNSLLDSLDYYPKVNELSRFSSKFQEDAFTDLLNERTEILIEAFLATLN